mmetsp:Transcript_51522/g.133859  ORF Transcript_51522/g.133859 Transcript_51522/m.133859 type:complete len:89 (+) Transcript_51522:526-792(+)
MGTCRRRDASMVTPPVMPRSRQRGSAWRQPSSQSDGSRTSAKAKPSPDGTLSGSNHEQGIGVSNTCNPAGWPSWDAGGATTAAVSSHF